MARVTATEVKQIIETELPDATVEAFINTANVIVNQNLAGNGYSDAVLKEIELYLSAHFVAMRERQATSERVGDASINYGGSFGLGLDFTQYGQQAKILDYNGNLTNLGKAPIIFRVY